MAALAQIDVPAAARGLSGLTRIDYEDAFLIGVGNTGARPAEEWARNIMEGAPVKLRDTLRSGWAAIGLKLDEAPPERTLLGWEIRSSTPDHVVLGAGAGVAVSGELLFVRRPDAVLFCTFVELDGAGARALWSRVEPDHVRLVRRLLESAIAGP